MKMHVHLFFILVAVLSALCCAPPPNASSTVSEETENSTDKDEEDKKDPNDLAPIAVRPGYCGWGAINRFEDFSKEFALGGKLYFQNSKESDPIALTGFWDGKQFSDLYVGGTGIIGTVGKSMLLLPVPDANGQIPTRTQGPVSLPLQRSTNIPLKDALKLTKDDDWYVRACGMWYLARCKREVAAKTLVAGLSDPNWYVIMYSAQSLAFSKNQLILQNLDTVDKLLNLCTQTKPEKTAANHWNLVRSKAIDTIVALDARVAIPRFHSLLEKEKNEIIKKKLTEAIESLEKQR